MIGQLELAFLGEKVDRLFRHFGIERRVLLEIRQQFGNRARIEQRTRQAVLSHLARLLKHVDIFFAELRVGMGGIVRVDQLRESQRTSHARRPAADNDHIGRHLRTLHTFDRFAEDQHKFQVPGFEFLARPNNSRQSLPVLLNRIESIRPFSSLCTSDDSSSSLRNSQSSSKCRSRAIDSCVSTSSSEPLA